MISASCPDPTTPLKQPSTRDSMHAPVGPNPTASHVANDGLPGFGYTPPNFVLPESPFSTMSNFSVNQQGDNCPPRPCGAINTSRPPSVPSTGIDQPCKPATIKCASPAPKPTVWYMEGPKVPKYSGKANFIDFRSQFECIAEDYEWTYEEMGKQLSLCLTEEALSVLPTIKQSARRNYWTLCETLSSLHNVPGGELASIVMKLPT